MCGIFRGHDFRTSFSRLGRLRPLTNVPFMALTATASPEVEKNICQSLQLVNPVVISCNLNHPNIYLFASCMNGYQVRTHTCTYNWGPFCKCITVCTVWTDLTGIAHWLETLPPLSISKTIIFCADQNIACKLYGWLLQNTAMKGVGSMYQANLTGTTKREIQCMFQKASNLRCLVATVAFGMVLKTFHVCYNAIVIARICLQ